MEGAFTRPRDFAELKALGHYTANEAPDRLKDMKGGETLGADLIAFYGPAAYRKVHVSIRGSVKSEL